MKSLYRTIILLLGLTALPLFTGSAQAREKEEFSRGIETSTFVPKGYWITGGSFSYSENTASDYEMLIVEDIDGTNYSFKVSPFVDRRKVRLQPFNDKAQFHITEHL